MCVCNNEITYGSMISRRLVNPTSINIFCLLRQSREKNGAGLLLRLRSKNTLSFFFLFTLIKQLQGRIIILCLYP